MPKQKDSLFSASGPAILFDQPNQKWSILKGVSVASGDNSAILTNGHDGGRLINKGFIIGSTTPAPNAGFRLFDSDNVTIENRETGYMAGFTGLFADSSDGISLLNEGTIAGSLYGVLGDDSSGLTIENHGAMSGGDAAVVVNFDVLDPSGPLIKNFGTLTSEGTQVGSLDEATIILNIPDAKATIKNKGGGLIENNSGGLAVVVLEGRLNLNNKGTIIGGVDAADKNSDDIITNHGQITGQDDVPLILTYDGDDTVTNKGTITFTGNSSAVWTGGGNDTVINEGTIDKGVNLSDGNDVYKNKGGKVNGRIDPGSGNDKLVLGNSKDKIEFDDELGATNLNRVKNFESGKDKFFLDASDEFFGLTLGTLQKSEFTRGTEAKGPGAQIIYDKPSGDLWFAPSGSDKILFAELDDDTKLKHDDFTVYA
ncbi:hypothetical protein [Bauldia sp.]|uniref:hypothetical protein n=1 Tax=Bauldia sp. TaxID=2575872 RepID=UPI003BAB8FBE